MDSWPNLRPDLAALEGYHSPQVEVDVRLNTNESPYPPPAEWLERVARATLDIGFHRYPDRSATTLRDALAHHHGVSAGEIFCANGSNEVLQLLFLAFGGPGRSVGLFEPTYTLHAHIARLTGTNVVPAQRDGTFAIPEEAKAKVLERQPSLVFLCSPNNPTGAAENRQTVEGLLAATASWGGLVVVDEAYGQFAPWSAIDLRREDVPGSERLVVVRTFSKTWSMAGLRLGYLVADPRVVAAMDLVALPYHLDAWKQQAGTMALEYVDDMNQAVERIRSERQRVVEALGCLKVTQWPTDANFVLFAPEGVSADTVWEKLLLRSVLVRNCSSWPGLEGCLRVTIGRPDENDRFLEAMKEIL